MTPLGKFVVAGGTGFIGGALCDRLVADGAEVIVLTRGVVPARQRSGVRFSTWDGSNPGPWIDELAGARAIVNLAGENLASGRWSRTKKLRLRTSRIEPTRALIAAIRDAPVRPSVLLQASAVGFYGASDDREVGEESPTGSGFLPDLCRGWEGASDDVEALGVRRVLLRTGIVLSPRGGALAKMLPPFRLGLGGPLGDGQQWLPWIHLADAVEAIRALALRDDLAGVFNLTAPEPATNLTFTRALARTLHRPALFRVPGFALRWALGELGETLLTGQRVLPRRLLAADFRFAFPGLGDALADLLVRPGR